MTYGDVARLPFGRETFSAGAFGDVSALDVRMNIQHDRRRMIARTGGGGLLLTDSPERLLIRADLPETRDADDALLMVHNRMLRGLSVEFDPLSERTERDLRIVDRAALSGVGLVDIPAYPQSIPQVRQNGEGLTGAFNYDTDQVIADTGRRRKQRVRAGAFEYALRQPDREINLILGSPERPLASKMAGTLELEDTPDALNFSVRRLPPTSYARDFLGLLRAGSIIPGIVPFFLLNPNDPDAEREEEEEGNPGVFRVLVFSAVLTALAIMFRAPRGNPGAVSARADDLDDLDGGLVIPKRRKRLWL